MIKKLSVALVMLTVVFVVVWFVRQRVKEQIAIRTNAGLCDVLILQSQTSEMLLDQVSAGYKARDRALKRASDWQAGRITKEENRLGYYSGSSERAVRHQHMIDAVCQSANVVHMNMRRIAEMMVGDVLPGRIESIDCEDMEASWLRQKAKALNEERYFTDQCETRFGTKSGSAPAPLVLFIE